MTANNSLAEALKPDLTEPEYFELELATKGIFTALFRFSNYTAATMAMASRPNEAVKPTLRGAGSWAYGKT